MTDDSAYTLGEAMTMRKGHIGAAARRLACGCGDQSDDLSLGRSSRCLLKNGWIRGGPR